MGLCPPSVHVFLLKITIVSWGIIQHKTYSSLRIFLPVMFDLRLCYIYNRITVVLLCTAVLLYITSYLLLCIGEQQDSLDFSCEPYFLAHHCFYYLTANIRLNLVLLMSLCQDLPWILDRGECLCLVYTQKQLPRAKVKEFSTISKAQFKKKDTVRNNLKASHLKQSKASLCACCFDESSKIALVESSLFPRPCLCLRAVAGAWFIFASCSD